MRLDKFLAEASVGTRKIVRNYVKDGKVTVNNQEIMNPAYEIEQKADVVRYLGITVENTGKIYYMFNKPAGCITARKDANTKTVLDYFDKEVINGLFPVGRLDKDTEGLLLLTNDGDLCHKLMYPDKHIEKKYYFWAFGSLDFKDMELLKSGLSIGSAEPLTKSAKIQVETEGTFEEFKDKMNMVHLKKIKKNPYEQPVVAGYISITEGRKHQVKRMLKAVGCYVVYLKRVSIGGLILDESLEKGQYRDLTENEILTLLN